MDLNLSGRRALISGGSKGIGLAIATSLAAEGCDLHLAARTQSELDNNAMAYYANPLRRAFSVLKLLRGFMELAVLGEFPRRQNPGLINHLWIRAGRDFWKVVALIDQGCSAVFETIPVWSIRPHRHQNHGMIATKAEIHSSLEANTFAPTHFVMR